METHKKILAMLDEHGCEYTTQHHEPTLTSEESARVRGVSMHSGAKAIVVTGDKTGQNVLLVMPADMKLYGGAVKRLLGEKISFAKNVEEITGCKPGSVPPFGSLFGLRTIVDPRLADNEIINFNAASLTDSVGMPYQAYIEIEKPDIIQIAKEKEA